MFNLFRKKAIKFSEAWQAEKKDNLAPPEKLLYNLAKKIQETRAANPANLQISEDARERMRENFYLKYSNIIGFRPGLTSSRGKINLWAKTKAILNKTSPEGSQKNAQKIKEQTLENKPRKETLMPMQPKNKMVFVFVTAAVIILALSFGYHFTKNQNDSRGNQKINMTARLAVADGEVQIWGGDDWKTISVGTALAKDSQLRTGENSKAVLEFDEGSAMRLDENSHVILKEISNQKIIVLQIAGESYNRVNKTIDLIYQVQSENTETTALGTAFGVVSQNSDKIKKGEKKIIVKVVESKVKVKIIKGEENLEKEVSESEQLIVDTTKPIEDAAKKVPLDKDEVVKDNFYIWNREEDAKKSYPLGMMDDMTPPEIKIAEPLDGIKTELIRVAVKGTTEAGARVWVNGAEVENQDGAFEKVIDLKIGANAVEVKAKDGAGNLAVKKITVTRELTEPIQPNYSLYLKGYADTDGVRLSWSVAGLEVPKGFKLVKSLEPYPTYPGDSSVWIDGTKRSYVWKILDGKTYYFRICVYKDGSCGTYSNNLKITAKSVNSSTEVKGTLSLNGKLLDNKKVKLYWTLSGSAPFGFKLVKSLEPNPVYPGNDYVYLSSPDVRSYVWEMTFPGNYHFRVCAYNGNGACVFYSNEITIPVQ